MSEEPGAVASGAPPASEDEKGIAAVAYILTWITGLIIFFVAKDDQKYAKWNAIQAIGLGIAAFAIGIVLNIIGVIVGAGSAFSPGGGFGAFAIIGLLSGLLWLAIIVLIVLSAIKAYQGTPLRLPIVADFADKNVK